MCNFFCPYVALKYEFGANLVKIGSVVETTELATDIHTLFQGSCDPNMLVFATTTQNRFSYDLILSLYYM